MLIQENIPLSAMTTFKIGGNAAYFVKVKNLIELRKVVKYAKFKKLPIFIIGNGSNVLISDEGINSLVIRLDNKGIEKTRDSKSKTFLKIAAGTDWDDFVKEAVKMNLQGAECLSGIPGTVGAAPVQNIGAYGQDIENILESVWVFDTKIEKLIKLEKEKCKLGYRDSLFKKNQGKKYIIWEVEICLNKNTRTDIKYESLKSFLKARECQNPSLKEVRKAILNLRKVKLEDPKKVPNAGSYFKNPIVKVSIFEKLKQKYPDIPFYKLGGKVKLFAGWFIERAGWKGKEYKNAGISRKNSLLIVNKTGRATAKEVKELEKKIQNDIKKKYGINLKPEVEYIKT